MNVQSLERIESANIIIARDDTGQVGGAGGHFMEVLGR